MNILFYFPTNKTSVSLETLMEEFTKYGHQVFLLGTEPKGIIHQTVEKYGVKTHVHLVPQSPSWKYYLNHILFLRHFIQKNRIDLVYSHTQPVNFIAIFTQYLVKAKFYICRHHSDYIMTGTNKNAKRFDRIINALGKDFIVPSRKVYDQMTRVEKVPAEKVRLINYAYRFEHYPIPDPDRIEEIRKLYPAQLLLCTVSRFIPCKRYEVLISCVAGLIQQGLDINLMILGDGPLESALKKQVKDLQMENHIFFIGYTTEVMTYMAASDMVVHFSDSEASNSVIKEAGLLEKLVAVCEDVGDFDDYIVDGESGFLLEKVNPCNSFGKLITEIYGKHTSYNYGPSLKVSVIDNYQVDNVIQEYKEIF